MKYLFKSIILMILIATLIGESTAQNQTATEKALELHSKGPEHQILNKMSGKWRILYKINPVGMFAQPEYGKGSSDNRIIMGEKFLEMESSMIYQSMKLNMKTIIGYDRPREKFTFYNFDASKTSSFYALGDYNKKEKTITFHGNDYDPIEKKKLPYKITIRFERDDKFIQETYITDDGREHKYMEVVYIKLNK